MARGEWGWFIRRRPGVGQMIVLITNRGEPAMGRVTSRHNLVFGWTRAGPDHEAAIRFSGEAPRRRAHSSVGNKAMAHLVSPPPRIVIGDLSRMHDWPSKSCVLAPRRS